MNESVALNGQIIGVFRNYRTSAGGFRPPREQYRLQVGVTYLVTRRLFVEPTVTVGLGGASPDLVLGLSIPTCNVATDLGCPGTAPGETLFRAPCLPPPAGGRACA